MLATDPECVVYCAMADNRMGRAMKDVRRILAAGINVVGSAPVPLQYPWHVLPDQYIAPLEDAAQRAGSSRQTVEQVRRMEIADYATVMFDVMGFGKPLDETPLQLQPGLLATAWGSSIRQLAAGLGIDVDEITEAYEREPAPEAFVATGHIPNGGQAAVRFEIRGMVKAHPAIVIEHVTRSSRCSGAVAVAKAACSGANMGLNTMSLARGG